MRQCLLVLGVAVTLAGCLGCSWGSRESRENTRTGISPESGYPKGSPADAGSPALGTAQRESGTRTGAKEAKEKVYGEKANGDKPAEMK